jgi:hypothetical protein
MRGGSIKSGGTSNEFVPPLPALTYLLPPSPHLHLPGYWTVRGFEISSEEPDDPMDSIITDAEEGFAKMKELMDKKKKKGGDEDGGEKTINPKITAVVLMEDQSSVAVGRSDGTVFAVKIGSESYAAFVKKQAIAMNAAGSVSTRMDFVREDDLFQSAADDGADAQPEEVSGRKGSDVATLDTHTHQSLKPTPLCSSLCSSRPSRLCRPNLNLAPTPPSGLEAL